MKKTIISLMMTMSVSAPSAISAEYNNPICRSPEAGFQLLMTSEQRNKTERIIIDLNTDIEKLSGELDRLLYRNSDAGKVKKDDIRLTVDSKQVITNLSALLAGDFDKLANAFKSIYLVYGASDYYKKHFESIKKYRQILDTPEKSVDVQFLFSLQKQSEAVKPDLIQIEKKVKDAQLKTSEYIKARISQMSVWQWLFGY